MSTVIGAFKATLGIDVSEYTSGILSANATTEIFGQTFTNFLANPVLGGIGLLKNLGASLISAAGDNLEYAETIQRVAQETGASTDTLQTLREMLEDAGVSADQAQVGLAKFADMLGTARRDGGPAADAIRDLGLNLEQVGDGDHAIRMVLEALSRIPSASARADLAAALFGRTAGPVLANALKETGGDLGAVTEELRKFGLVLSEDTLRSSGELDATMDSLGNAFEGIKRTAMSEFLDGVAKGLGKTKIEGDDVANVLDRIGPVAEKAGAAFGSLAKGLENFANSDVVQGLKALGDVINGLDRLGDMGGRGGWWERHFPFATSLTEQAGNIAYGNGIMPLRRDAFEGRPAPYAADFYRRPQR